jgi:hypothetical protein
MVFTPPSKVYRSINKRIIKVAKPKLMFRSLKINNWSTLITRYNRAVAPKVLEIIKNKAPVL